MNQKLQVTLALLKPDVAVNPVAINAITDKILSKNLQILEKRTLYWKRKDAEAFYKQHQGRFFYERLLDYITSGPIVALVLAGQDAIQNWRGLMGPTKTFKATFSHPYCMRGEFGLTDTRNSTHGSDSKDSAKQEIEMIFGKDWLTTNMPVSKNCIRQEKIEDRTYWDEEKINQTLGLPEYWASFYDKDKPKSASLEWFMEYEDLKDYILPAINKAVSRQPHQLSYSRLIVLDIGCGDSMLGPNIAKKVDVADVYCIDFVAEALHKFRHQIDSHETFDNVKNCFLINANLYEKLPFKDNSVRVIIDKGATDSILKQDGGQNLVTKTMSNIFKSLSEGGIFLKITDEPPEIHMELLQEAVNNIHPTKSKLSISCRQISPDNERECFMYTVNKS